MNKLYFAAIAVATAKAVALLARPRSRKSWRNLRPESVATFRKIHASKQFTAEAAHKAFAGAKFVK